MISAESIPPLPAAEAAAIEALLDPSLTLAGVAARLNLKIPEFLALLRSPSLREAIQTLAEAEAFRRRVLHGPAASTALGELTKLLGTPAADPVETRRAATAILRDYRRPEWRRQLRPYLARHSKSPAASALSSPGPDLHQELNLQRHSATDLDSGRGVRVAPLSASHSDAAASVVSLPGPGLHQEQKSPRPTPPHHACDSVLSPQSSVHAFGHRTQDSGHRTPPISPALRLAQSAGARGPAG